MILTDFEKSVEEWFREAPETLLILEKLHLDYDQVRGQSMGAVCQRQSLDPHSVSMLVRGFRKNGRLLDETVLEGFDIPQLIGYILFNHHHYMDREIPRLERVLEETVREDAGAHAELLELHEPLRRFLSVFQAHMLDEETQLFPFCMLLHSDPQAAALGPEGLENLIRVIHREDAELLLDLGRVREKTRWYHVPPDAGSAYRELLCGLRGLEIDLRRHMRVESRILYPKVVALGSGMIDQKPPTGSRP